MNYQVTDSDSGTETVTVISSSDTESVTVIDSDTMQSGNDATIVGADVDGVPGMGDDAVDTVTITIGGAGESVAPSFSSGGGVW